MSHLKRLILIYRFWIEPRVLPDLEVGLDRQGIGVRRDLAGTLEGLRSGPGMGQKS